MSAGIAWIALEAIKMINEQVEKGIDINGNKYAYSTNPMRIPYKKRLAKYLKSKDRLTVYKEAGKLRMLVHGGYKDYRKMMDRDADGDFLQFTGAMMAALVITSNDMYSATIGFNDALSAKKALMLNNYGVGAAHKLWKFFGFTKENLAKIESYCKDIITITGEMEIKYK
jgi:hypothetical protein